uniref:ASABF n=1 Tax=Ascaris suum TaxID=6253 RepID=P90683_ASCSU|nr:ASABF [Ascaris suum]BAA89497.1 ASABF-alpha [Ascaris suum]
MKTAIIVVLLVIFASTNAAVDFSSCARMDVPGLSKVAQGLCISSCKFQNCGTGHCEKRGGRPTCVCDRCGRGGGEWPSVPMPKGRSSRGRRHS